MNGVPPAILDRTGVLTSPQLGAKRERKVKGEKERRERNGVGAAYISSTIWVVAVGCRAEKGGGKREKKKERRKRRKSGCPLTFEYTLYPYHPWRSKKK